MIGVSFASRAKTGGSALAVPFDGSNLDLTAGPKGSLTAFGPTTSSSRFTMGSTKTTDPAYVGNALSGQLIRYASAGGAYQIGLYPNGAQISNVDSDIGLYNYDTNSATVSSIVNARVCTDINAQYRGANITAAVDAGGLIKNVDVSGTSEDGLFPGYDNGKEHTPGQWTVIEGVNAVGPGAFNYYAGFPYGGPYPWVTGDPQTNTGLLLTKAQVNGATPYAAGLAVTNGEFVTANTATIGPALYQCLAAGTLNATDDHNTWPTATGDYWDTGSSASVFTSGTATMCFIGGGIHSDGAQTTGRQCVVFRHCRIYDFANSCILIQNAGGNSNPTPLMNWVVEHSRFRGGGNFAFYVQSQTDDANYTYGGTADHNQQGGFTRVSPTSWTTAANPGKSRPWHTSFRDLTMLTALYGPDAGTLCTMQQCMAAQGVVYVDSEARRDALIAAQFGWDATDQRLALMRQGTYDYVVAGFPAPVSSVMEARLQAAITAVGTNSGFSATPGALDARCMVVWERNIRNQSGGLIIPASGSVPTPANTAITDAQGYYTGG